MTDIFKSGTAPNRPTVNFGEGRKYGPTAVDPAGSPPGCVMAGTGQEDAARRPCPPQFQLQGQTAISADARQVVS